MKKTPLNKIAQAVEGRLIGDGDVEIDLISKDTRDMESGALFFAIAGRNYDAHDFVFEAFCKGASAAVVQILPEEIEKKGESVSPAVENQDIAENYIVVDDVVKALQRLAAFYLDEVDPGRIAITGSTGKTSTKDILYTIMNTKFKAARNIGNYNNEIGLPLSILAMDEDTETVVLEMGMDRPGEIRLLSNIVHPDVGVITNIGLAHIENFKDQEGIFNAKMEITEGFTAGNKLIVYEDDAMLGKVKSDNYQIITVGNTGRSDFIISGIKDDENGLEFHIEHMNEIQKFIMPISGRHNAINTALAVAVAFQFGISLSDSADAVKKIELSDKRLAIKGKEGLKVIDDTYNANPDSMRSALDVLKSQNGLRKIAVLGDMYELGDKSAEYHREVGKYAAETAPDMLVTVGSNSEYISDEAAKSLGDDNVRHFESREDAVRWISENIAKGDVILVKGSRGMKMEEIVEVLLA